MSMARLWSWQRRSGKGRRPGLYFGHHPTWGRDFETKWGEPINPSLPLTESNCDSRYYRQFG
jgi:hypothetical protein